MKATRLLVVVVLAAGCNDSGFKSTPMQPRERSTSVDSVKWYSGGTLHNKSALDWQSASSRDKLATCADLVTALWQSGKLKESITDKFTTVDDVRPYAQELVDFLDAAFKPEPNPEQNRKVFVNQTVSSHAIIGVVTMGWTK